MTFGRTASINRNCYQLETGSIIWIYQKVYQRSTVPAPLARQSLLETFKKYVRSRFLSFYPSPSPHSGHHWCMTKVSDLWRCPFYRESFKNQKSSKVNMKPTICHDFPSPDLLEKPKLNKTAPRKKGLYWTLPHPYIDIQPTTRRK